MVAKRNEDFVQCALNQYRSDSIRPVGGYPMVVKRNEDFVQCALNQYRSDSIR